MSRPDFATMARAWLVRAQGHATPSNEQSLAAELERLWELGIANAIEALRVHDDMAADEDREGLLTAEDRLRALLDKPADPRAS